MKTLVITLGLLLAPITVLAEPPEGRQGGDRAQHRARMQQELGLSEEQVQQMREIREQGGSREDMQSILTDEQQGKMQEMRANNKGGREQRMTRMQENLGLSDEQMHEIREQGGGREEMHAILTDEQRATMEARRKNNKGNAEPPQE